MGKQSRRSRSGSQVNIETLASECLGALVNATQVLLPMITSEAHFNDFSEMEFQVTIIAHIPYVLQVFLYNDASRQQGKVLDLIPYNAQLLGRFVRPMLPYMKGKSSFRLGFTKNDNTFKAAPSDALTVAFPVSYTIVKA